MTTFVELNWNTLSILLSLYERVRACIQQIAGSGQARTDHATWFSCKRQKRMWVRNELPTDRGKACFNAFRVKIDM